MRLKACLTVLLVLVATSVLAPPAGAATAPGLTVSPTTGLTQGSTVRVRGEGLPAGVEVAVVECDMIFDDDFGGSLGDCPALATPTTSATGTVTVDVRVVSVTSRREFGANPPVYCSQNRCRMFLVWQDEDFVKQHLDSAILEFATPTTASIVVRPSDDLGNLRWVTASGVVNGGAGRRVQVFEQACFSLIQADGCYGALPVRWGTVKDDGTYRVKYPARRHLADGTDCTNPDMLGACRMTLVVLDARGRRDDRYGVSSKGDPGAALQFSGGTAAASPSTGLVRGSAVTLRASGLTPGADLQVVQCDSWEVPDGNGGACPALTTLRASGSGTLSSKVTLVDLIYHEFYDGTKRPVYCRDDQCRLFLVAVDDQGGSRLEALTQPLSFTGSSATLKANPTSNLAATKWTTLWGSATGAEGRSLRVVEQACYPTEQFKPCYGQLPVRWGRVKADGTFVVKYPAQRYLGDDAKTDCRDTGTEATCRISVVVLDAGGKHDDSFGVQHLGQPGVEITFKE